VFSRAGQGLRPGQLAQAGPDGGQLGGDVVVTVDKVVAVAGDCQGTGQVGVVAGGDPVQGGPGLGEDGRVPAGQVQHPVVAGPIQGECDHLGQVTEVIQQPEVAGEQVLR